MAKPTLAQLQNQIEELMTEIKTLQLARSLDAEEIKTLRAENEQLTIDAKHANRPVYMTQTPSVKAAVQQLAARYPHRTTFTQREVLNHMAARTPRATS